MNELLNLFDRETAAGHITNAFAELQQSEPELRRKDIADRLQVPEAALLDNQCAVQSVRLQPDFKAIIERMPELGYVMSLTRNHGVVHERKGCYSNVRINGPMGLVITEDRKIDLRIILTRWAFAFAVAEEIPKGHRFSLQFFDHAGVAIQKVFLQADSNEQAYRQLVEEFRAQDQTRELEYKASADEPEYAADAEVDAPQLRKDWNNMTDVHQFFGMLRRYKVSREQAFRIAGAPHAVSVSPAVLETVLTSAADSGLSIMCFVGNHGNIQIHTGPVKNIKLMGPWLNVLDEEFNLHLMQPRVRSGWLVRKPTEDGTVTSLEFYDEAGETLAQFFGERQEGNPENPVWRELAESTLTMSVGKEEVTA
ncbi:MAG: hemin-degrading factor [Amphritea sp.]|nr:hemin-degrading factor [Amphritea sp.]